MITYPPLSTPAPRRLAMFRAEAAKPKWIRPMTWRDVRFANLRSEPALSVGSNGTWYSHSGPYFRNEQFADEVADARIDHRGWFTDGEEETARGIVAQLPHGRFLAGYMLSMNDERVYYPEIHDSARDAALMADEHARVIGELESEHAARFNAALSLESKIDDSLRRLQECVILRHRMDYARAEIPELIESIREDRETLSTEFKGVL